MRYLTIFFLLIFATLLKAQELEDYAAELADLGFEILSNPELEKRKEASVEFQKLLKEALQSPSAFQYPFDEVQNLSKLSTDDAMFRFFTWMMPLGNGQWQHFGIVMQREAKDRYKLIELTDAKNDISQPEYVALYPDRWFGALYYQVVTVKHKKETYYMLMGFDPHSRSVQRKLIDVASIDENGRLVFGAKIFDTPEIMDKKYLRKPFRLLFDYSAQVAASIKYRDEEKKIIMDHLAAPDASQKNLRMVYGPDFSYDALVWKKGKWILEEDIKIKTQLTLPNPTPPVKEKRN